MKKYFALIISIVLILTLFTACKPKLKGGMVIGSGNDTYAAVTKEDGGIIRDDAGNLVVLVTDAKGRNVKGDDGELLTNAVAIERPIVIGRRIECPYYAINIPDGWSDSKTASDLIIKRDGSEDQIKIITAGDISLSDAVQGSQELINNIRKYDANSVVENKGIKIGDIDANYISVFAPDVNGAQIYQGFIFFKQNSNTYSVSLSSNRNFGENLDEVISILETIEFIYE